MLDLKGRVAIVTGAARGIGHATSMALLAEGVKVVMVDKNDSVHDCATMMEHRSGVWTQGYVGDVTDLNFMEEVFEGSLRLGATPSLLVPCAGIAINGRSWSVERDTCELKLFSKEDWDTTIALNLTAPYYWACRLMGGIEQMRRRSGEGKWRKGREEFLGSTVLVSSIVGLLGNFGQGAYSAAKSGLLGLQQTLAIEGADWGMACGALCPGFVDTPMVGDLRDETRESIIRATRSGCLIPPEDVAQTVVFMLKNPALAGYIDMSDGIQLPLPR